MKVLSAVHKDHLMNKLTAQINFFENNLDIYTESQLHILLAYIQLPVQQGLHFFQTPESKLWFVCRKAATRRRKMLLNQILMN